METFRQILRFVVKRKKLWMIPLLVSAFFLGWIVVVTQGAAISPFLYALF